MKKEIRIIAIVVSALLVVAAAAVAETQYRISVNGRLLQPEVPPQNINGRLMVPLRFVAEALGAEVKYDDATKTAIVNYSTASSRLSLEHERILDDIAAASRMRKHLFNIKNILDFYESFGSSVYVYMAGGTSLERLEQQWSEALQNHNSQRLWFDSAQAEYDRLWPNRRNREWGHPELDPNMMLQYVIEARNDLEQAKILAVRRQFKDAEYYRVSGVNKLILVSNDLLQHDQWLFSETLAALELIKPSK